MPEVLAVDAGGTSTRAVALDSSGRVSGYGRAGSGNPTSAGIPAAVTAIGQAAQQALAGRPRNAGLSLAVLAQAGEWTAMFREQVTARLAALGVGRVILQTDLMGVFHAGTVLPDGYVLVAGTGSIAARVREDRLDRVVGGKGWLLGDAGSGYWIGHQIARAVVAALDGQGPATALTRLVLDAAAVPVDPDAAGGRADALSQLVSRLYTWRPVQLSGFAPLAFAVPEDAVARRILEEAAAAIANLLEVVRVPGLSGPVVAGGSVLVSGLLAGPPVLRQRLVPPDLEDQLVPVPDGVVGAAALALRNAGTDVDEGLFSTIRTEVARAAEASA